MNIAQEESACTLKERLHSFAIGVVLGVVIMAIGWSAVLITWAANGGVLINVPSLTGQPMTEFSAGRVAENAGFQAVR